MKTPIFLCLFGVGCLTSFGHATAADDKFEHFEKKIRPVLASHCLECHGPQKAESNLRLDHISFLSGEGAYGPVLIPGEPENSSLFVSLTHANEDLMMPLERDKLAASVVKDFRQWIAEGAVWPTEPVPSGVTEPFDIAARKQRLPWIWQTPQQQPAARVRNATWPRGDIDRFVLAELEAAGLRPASDAAPEVWLRRVHYAITGLPPKPSEIKDFLADPSDAQREVVVDQLLNSPHFGERWARHWMDLVRYAESRGHESDFVIANSWHYRDYLIRAFNDDVPYDQFVVEHIAGDLLASPRVNQARGFNESILATAWPFFGEEIHSPVDIRQDECDRIDNKIDVFSKTFLGLTVACARCHDHKFDAISQQDYYSLAGFLLSSHFRQVRFETREQNAAIARELDSLYQQTQRELGELVQATFRPHVSEAAKLVPQPQSLNSDLLPSVIIDFADPKHVWRTSGFAFGQSAQRVGSFVIPDDPAQPLADVVLRGAARRDPIWNSLKPKPGNEVDAGSLNAVGRSAGLVSTPTFRLDQGTIHVLMKGEAQIYAAIDSHLMITGPLHRNLVTTHKTPEAKWITLDLGGYQGHRLHLEFGPVGQTPLSIFKVIQGPRPTAVPIVDAARSEKSNGVSDAIVSDALDAVAKPNMSQQQAFVIDWLLKHTDQLGVDPSFREQQRAIVAKYHQRRATLAEKIQTESLTAIALMDGSGVDERVLNRGKYQSPGKPASRRLPVAFELGKLDGGPGSGRLQLAQQLVDPANPLTSRVIVNRIWHHLIGRGIVASVDNFGYLGSRPTHPELLDHLAHQFVHQDQWSIKTMIKRILLSRTFGMSSRPDDAEAEQQDPKNLLLHRMPVRRLDAEAIRDSLLAVSGRLDPKLYGQPVPVHLTEFVIGRGRPNKSGPLDGDGRRSIYTSVRRNFLPTMMLTFDMPTPFSTVGRRNVTNVPAQTLALMNDKLVYDQAAVWARQLQAEFPSASSAEKIQHIYWQACGRAATSEELTTTLQTIDALAQLHGTAAADIKVWTDVCHTMFRVNEFIYLR